VRESLAVLLPEIVEIRAAESIGGGCISRAERITVVDSNDETRDLFIKSNEASFLDNFRCEWDGLVRLREPGVIGVPKPIAADVVDGRAWLVTEWIEQQPRSREFFALFGAALARLHQATLGTQIGLETDNYLGSARQINTPCDSWVEFVAEYRIGCQLRWAVDQNLADGELQRDVQRILDSMDQILAGRDEQTCLLHGDLWSGNYLCGPGGQPFVLDPAVHYGCPEAEFGMLRLFGSCGDMFYQAYEDRFPLPAGWQRRVNVYVLYHLLNHLNLFGTSYLGQCRSVAAEILSA